MIKCCACVDTFWKIQLVPLFDPGIHCRGGDLCFTRTNAFLFKSKWHSSFQHLDSSISAINITDSQRPCDILFVFLKKYSQSENLSILINFDSKPYARLNLEQKHCGMR
jgi:hypothetical protein